MLSSTAKNLYWMGRYLQRAKSTARLIEATQRMALQSRGEEAAGVAAIFGMEDEFRQTQQQSSGRLAIRMPTGSTTSPGRKCWPASARCAPTGASIAARSIP